MAYLYTVFICSYYTYPTFIYIRQADSPQQGLSHRRAHLPHRDGRGTLIIMYMYVCICNIACVSYMYVHSLCIMHVLVYMCVCMYAGY